MRVAILVAFLALLVAPPLLSSFLLALLTQAIIYAMSDIVQDIQNRRINITFEVIEGPEVTVERINISGNTRSQEKILRREIPMAEGDLFTSQKLARARQRHRHVHRARRWRAAGRSGCRSP